MGYGRSAAVYDAVYGAKDYAGEAERLHALIQDRKPGARTLLEVACGTGRYLEQFRRWYDVEGLDLSVEQLEIARRRVPDVRVHEADMREFDLGRRFDAVTCLFSSIGYVGSVERLHAAVTAMARHLEAGGVLVIEPWITPENWRDDTFHMLVVEEPELKLARANTSERRGDVSVMDMHYLVARRDGVEHFVERHELALFTDEQYRDACRAVGLAVEKDDEGLIGRGLYIAVARG